LTLVLPAVGLAVLPLLAPSAAATAAAATDPSHTVVVTPASTGTLHDFRVPLTGSPQYLVYRDSHVLTDSDVPRRGVPHDDPSSRQLEVRDASGTTRDLGAYPNDDGWSISGTTLAAIGAPHHVDYWDVTSGTSGHLLLPVKAEFAAAAPDGVLYVGVSGTATNSVEDHIYYRHFNGTVDDLGVAFAGVIPSVTSGDDGAVVLGDGAKYLSFATPASYVTLKPAAGLSSCHAVVGNFAACHGVDDNGDIRSDQIVPLDGTKATRTTVSPGYAALSGSTLLWVGGSTGSSTTHIFSLAAGSSAAPAHSTQSIGYTGSTPIVSALGGGVAAGAGDAALYLADSAHAITTAVAAKASPISAASFSLTSGRVAYNDDEAQGSARVSAYSTRFRRSGPTVSMAPQTLLKAGTYSGIVATSGAGSVYAVKVSTQTVNLTVVAPKRTHTITNALTTRPTLSGNRLLYFTATGKQRGETARIYDLTTGKTTTERTSSQCCLADESNALSGHTFAYIKSDNSIWAKNLDTGKSIKVRDAPKAVFTFTTPQVFVNGDYVGWAYQVGTGDHVRIVDGYRNVRTISTAVPVGKRIWQLSTTGVVLDNDITAEFSGGDVGNAAAFSFRAYSGTTFTLLRKQEFMQGPQVDGTTVGWIDEHGAVKLAPLAVDAAPPRYLGDPHASPGIANPGTSSYTAYLPYTATLTSCKVDITRAGESVTTLPCTNATAAQGGVFFRWTGTVNGHNVAAGAYTYVVHAAGQGGPALNSAGKPIAVRGTIAVG
jgi:hypothetical protein